MDSGEQRHHPFPPIQNPKSSIVFLAVTISTTAIILSAVLFFLYHLWRSLFRRSRTRPCDSSSPSPSDNLRRFTFRDLKDATDGFCSSNVIGKGGSGTVYRALLKDGKLAAVKLLDSSSSYQFEMEFQNEVTVLGGLKPGPLSEFVVSLLGFCVEKGRKAVVYEYMPNKSLQECLFSDKDLGLNWGKRFGIIQDVARALAFLHTECDPPVIHGDVKPSNVLLDINFRAKISDFGLSRLKTEDEIGGGDGGTAAEDPIEDNDEVDFALALQASSSSKSSCKIYHNVLGLSNNSLNFGFNCENGGDDHKIVGGGVSYVEELSSADHSKELLNCEGGAKQWGKDWWWRQDGSGELCSKDYVMEWIGSQICPNSDKLDWDEEKGAIEDRIVSAPVDKSSKLSDNREETDKNDPGIVVEKDDSKRWKKVLAVKKHRKMHEWWKEEERMDDDEIRKKKKRKKAGGMWCRRRFKVGPHFGLGKCFEFKRRRSSYGSKNSDKNGDDDDDEENMEFSFRRGWRSKSKNRDRSRSMGSEMWSGDLFSRELSSTTSMRGTLCYVAPEYNGFGYLMEKADVYSFGVLILVIVSGRRPLHVLSSPMKLERANLISWSRSLAQQAGNVLELVDGRLGDEYSREEASLCINLALACLQKMPELRPDIGDVVRILQGEMELPQLPYEFSPSPPVKNYSRSRRKQKITAAD